MYKVQRFSLSHMMSEQSMNDVNDDANLIDLCADAVLVLADGARVPCSRFVMSRRCPVLRVIAEMDTARVGDMHEIPVPDVGRAKYADLVAILHGEAHAPGFEAAAGVFDAARRLGADDVADEAVQTMWRTRDRAKRFADVLDVLPRLLVSGAAGDVMRAAVRGFPLWKDFRKRVLEVVGPDLDAAGARKVLDLCWVYPPAALAATLFRVCPRVADVAVDTFARTAGLLGPEELVKLAGVLAEIPTVSEDVRVVARAVARVDGWFDATGDRSDPSGSVVHFDTDDHRVVLAEFPMSPPSRKPVTLDRALRVQLPRHNTGFWFEVSPRKLAEIDGRAPRHVLVRLSVGRDALMEKPMWEAVFDVAGTDPARPAMPDDQDFRDFESVARCTRRPLYFRFDIRYGNKASWFPRFPS
jgi:hypothetical protein